MQVIVLLAVIGELLELWFDDRFSSVTILVEAKLIFVEKVLSSTLILQLILFVPHRSKKTHQQTTTDDGFKQYVQVLHTLKSSTFPDIA